MQAVQEETETEVNEVKEEEAGEETEGHTHQCQKWIQRALLPRNTMDSEAPLAVRGKFSA